jgi:hypothetical protein
VEVRPFLHKIRSATIANVNEPVKGIFDGHAA